MCHYLNSTSSEWTEVSLTTLLLRVRIQVSVFPLMVENTVKHGKRDLHTTQSYKQNQNLHISVSLIHCNICTSYLNLQDDIQKMSNNARLLQIPSFLFHTWYLHQKQAPKTSKKVKKAKTKTNKPQHTECNFYFNNNHQKTKTTHTFICLWR